MDKVSKNMEKLRRRKNNPHKVKYLNSKFILVVSVALICHTKINDKQIG